MSWRVRVDMAVALLLAVLALAAAVLTDRAPPRPEPADVERLPTPTPTVTATPGWWGSETPGPYRLGPMPTLPSAGRGAGTAGKPVKFQVKSCPTKGVRISKIQTAGGGWWNLYGEAETPNMWYWKAELSGDGGAHWTMLYRSDAPRNGLLMEFDTGTVQPGSYLLRLTAVDRTGNYPTPCTVQVEVR